MEEKKKVVVAFSGGLDTSFTVMYLAKEKGYEVYAACANTGGFSPEQLKTNEENAYKLGAKEYVTIDVTQEYYEKSLKYMVFGNVLRNGTYPISVSSERIFQALAIARYANEIGADAIAHGSTGAGNDQIRFDMTFLVLAPGVEIITLTRDMALSRQEEIDYLNKHGFSADFTKLKYSYNVGLWGTSICGGEILDSAQGLPESAYLKHCVKEGSEQLRLTFEKGELKAVNDEKFDDPIKAIQKVEEIGAAYGIGRDMHVGDTIIGRLCMFKHFHPAGRKKLNFIRVIALHPIDRSNFYCSHSGACVFFQIIRQVLFVYGTSQPPPSGTGTCFHRSVRPLLCLHYSTCGEQAKNYPLSFIHYSFGVL